MKLVLTFFRVGKTAILDRFISKRFIGSYKSTIGADFLTQEIWVDDKLSTLQIWVHSFAFSFTIFFSFLLVLIF